MKNIFVIFSVLLLSNISIGSNIPVMSEVKCRAKNSGGSVDLPVLNEIIGGTNIVVCGAELEKKKPEDRIFSEFSIKSVNSNGILSKSLLSVGARDTYRLSKQDDTLQIDEVVPTRNAWWPTFRSSLTCKKNKCSLSEKKCIFEKLPSADPSFFEELVRYAETDKVGQVPDDTLIVGAFELALAGNQKAIDFFSKRPKSLALDGSPALEYKESSSMIARLKKAGCLK